MKKFIPYNQTLFFNIEQISSYIQESYILRYNNEISHDEFRVLDIITNNPDVCQRDLAKLALRDCVRVGRILDNLEKKKLIERYNDTKGKRLVKKMKLTTNGKKIYNDILFKIVPETDKILHSIFDDKQLEELKLSLQKLHTKLSESIKVKI